jgi:hypothetical protein
VSNDRNRAGLVEILVQHKLVQELEFKEKMYDFAAFKGRDSDA